MSKSRKTRSQKPTRSQKTRSQKTKSRSRKTKSRSRSTKQLKGYGRVCDIATQRRPRKLSKYDYDINKISIKNYVEVNNKYYICPDIYDEDAKKPISIKEFTKHNYTSPHGKNNTLYFTGVNRELVRKFNKSNNKMIDVLPILRSLGRYTKPKLIKSMSPKFIEGLKRTSNIDNKLAEKACCYPK